MMIGRALFFVLDGIGGMIDQSSGDEVEIEVEHVV